MGDKVIAEYIWIDGTGLSMRSKQRTITKQMASEVSMLPEWNYDGSSCYQATTSNSQILLVPVKIYKDPFRGGQNILVLCQTFKWTDNTFTQKEPTDTNFRYHSEMILDKSKVHEPWFGIEQEYILFKNHGGSVFWPLGWPIGSYLEPQGQYYCSSGVHNTFGRSVMELHYKACLYAGVRIAGTNAEVLPAQWEFQIGPSPGIEIGDDLWMARYLLSRIAEDQGAAVSYHPKPIKGDWNGSGCHTNFSTAKMRAENGYQQIKNAIKRIQPMHEKFISVYGDHNEMRLSGAHETSSLTKFGCGAGHRGQSIRIPTSCMHDKCGYFEDRRPASNIDPYIVAAVLTDGVCSQGKEFSVLRERYDKFTQWKKEQDWFKNNKFY